MPSPLNEEGRGRRSSYVETLLLDARYGLRTLWRNPTFAVAVVLTLALGIGANTAIFTLLDRVALRALPVERPDQLYVLGPGAMMGSLTSDGVLERNPSFFSYPLFKDFREHTEAFSGLAAFSSYPVNAYLSTDDAAPGARLEKAEARLVSGGWVGVGVAIGLVVALGTGRLVSSLLFGLAPADPATIPSATAALVLVASVAGYWPARRASRLDPVRALRYE
jgi:hypothetical protein